MTRIARKTLCAPSNYSGSCSGGTRWRCGVEVCAKKRRSPHAWVASSIFMLCTGSFLHYWSHTRCASQCFPLRSCIYPKTAQQSFWCLLPYSILPTMMVHMTAGSFRCFLLWIAFAFQSLLGLFLSSNHFSSYALWCFPKQSESSKGDTPALPEGMPAFLPSLASDAVLLEPAHRLPLPISEAHSPEYFLRATRAPRNLKRLACPLPIR